MKKLFIISASLFVSVLFFITAHAQINQAVSSEVLELQSRPQRLMVDYNSNGLRIDSAVNTTLLNGKNTRFRWTRQNTDDGFLVFFTPNLNIYAVEEINKHIVILDKEGHVLHHEFGVSSYPLIFFQKGLKIRLTNGGDTLTTRDAWHMLKMFDENADGVIDRNDRVWIALNIIWDTDGDGILYTQVQNGVWSAPGNKMDDLYGAGIKSISVSPVAPNTFDEAGNLRVDGSFHFSNGKKGLISAVYFKEASDTTNKILRDERATDTWAITAVPGMKGVLGMLDINFPPDIERNIMIHQQTDNKFLRSVSRNDKTYTIAPSLYNFVLSTVPVENVPIQKGHITRLKAGFLNIVSEGDWHLYNESKQKFYTSGNKPQKIALPVGSYQLKLGEQFYPVLIKDKETVEL